MLLYAAGEGQKYSKDIGYIPLPEEVARQVRIAIATIEVTDEHLMQPLGIRLVPEGRRRCRRPHLTSYPWPTIFHNANR